MSFEISIVSRVSDVPDFSDLYYWLQEAKMKAKKSLETFKWVCESKPASCADVFLNRWESNLFDCSYKAQNIFLFSF